eukprot:scaffold15840_cov142-Skeletonema_marinoi.AAC.5
MEEDYATLIYQESQRRKAEAARAVAVGKKKSPSTSTSAVRRTSTRIAIAAAQNDSSIDIARGRAAAAKRKRKPSDKPAPRKVAKHKCIRLCSADGCTNQVQKQGLCFRHGAKFKLCSYEGCRKQAKVGGVCCRHGGKKTCNYEGYMEESDYAEEKDAPIKSRNKDYASGMGLSAKDVATKDVKNKQKKEDCAVGMEERKYATTKDVQITLR